MALITTLTRWRSPIKRFQRTYDWTLSHATDDWSAAVQGFWVEANFEPWSPKRHAFKLQSRLEASTEAPLLKSTVQGFIPERLHNDTQKWSSPVNYFQTRTVSSELLFITPNKDGNSATYSGKKRGLLGLRSKNVILEKASALEILGEKQDYIPGNLCHAMINS